MRQISNPAVHQSYGEEKECHEHMGERNVILQNFFQVDLDDCAAKYHYPWRESVR